MMKSKVVYTSIVMVVFVSLLIVWDIFVAVDGVAGDTISEIFLFVLSKHPIIPASWGVLSGHFFGKFKRRLSAVQIIVVLASVAVFLLFIDFCNCFFVGVLRENPIFVFLFFVPFGAVVWAQMKD